MGSWPGSGSHRLNCAGAGAPSDLDQRAGRGELLDVQLAGLSVCVQQGQRLHQNQAPRALHFAQLEDARRAQFKVQGVKFVFHQLQRKTQALVGKLGLQVQLGVSAEAGEDVVGSRATTHPKALRREYGAGQ